MCTPPGRSRSRHRNVLPAELSTELYLMRVVGPAPGHSWLCRSTRPRSCSSPNRPCWCEEGSGQNGLSTNDLLWDIYNFDRLACKEIVEKVRLVSGMFKNCLDHLKLPPLSPTIPISSNGAHYSCIDSTATFHIKTNKEHPKFTSRSILRREENKT